MTRSTPTLGLTRDRYIQGCQLAKYFILFEFLIKSNELVEYVLTNWLEKLKPKLKSKSLKNVHCKLSWWHWQKMAPSFDLHVLLSPNASRIPHSSSSSLSSWYVKKIRDGASQNPKIMGLEHARNIVINLQVIPTFFFKVGIC